MTALTIRVHPSHLTGTVITPASKSDAHRAMICGRLAGKTTPPLKLTEPWSDDLKATWQCLNTLLGQKEAVLDCGESGTTLRLLIPLAAALGRKVKFLGRGRLPARPLNHYKDIFKDQAVQLDMPDHASLPLELAGQLKAGTFLVPGHISSQYISGLLLALPLLDQTSQMLLTSPLESAPYVDMTIKTMAAHQVDVKLLEAGWEIKGKQHYKPVDYQVEADYSQAAFWLAAAYGGQAIQVQGLDANSVQGDRAILALLAAFKQGHSEYEIDVAQIPDLVPILAVAAALTPAVTSIVNGSRLRLKESDRLASTCEVLSAIGVKIQETADGLIIEGGRKIVGGQAHGHEDHRIVMALAIAALFSEEGVIIEGAQAVNKSYPNFFEDLRLLGGQIDEFDLG